MPDASAAAQPARVVVVVPCYNEAQRLDVEAFAAVRFGDCEVCFVFVDDGSTDGTGGVLQRLRDQRPDSIEVVECRVNVGKAEAVRRGVMRALEMRPDFVGYWDADLATPLSEIPSFVRVLRQRPEIFYVLGSRVRLLGRTIVRNPWRHYFGRCFATAASITLAMPVYDTQCGAKMFRAGSTVAESFATPFLATWVFDVELIARLRAAHARLVGDTSEIFYELPLQRWEDVGGSKVKAWDFARASLDLWRIWKAHHRFPLQ